MTASDRAAFLMDKYAQLFDLMQDVTDIRNELEENGCKAEAKRLDTVISKLNILSENLAEKSRKLSN